MSAILDKLLNNADSSDMKSYLIGLERGRVWAEDYADYFEIREWSETKLDQMEELVLPEEEDRYFSLLRMESPIELEPYIRGWINGVREIFQKY